LTLIYLPTYCLLSRMNIWVRGISKSLPNFTWQILCFSQLIKRYPKWKMSSSPTTWHNSLAKLRSNLHQESWKKQNYIYVLFFTSWKLILGILLYLHFFFTLPPGGKHRWQPLSARAYIYARRGECWQVSIFPKLVCQTGVALRASQVRCILSHTQD
jgi:hypothetical protein